MARGRLSRIQGPGIRPGEWTDDAACDDQPQELFYPDDNAPPETWAVGKSVCARCEVRQQCLEYALKGREKHGLWGGLTPRERNKVKRQRDRMRRMEWISSDPGSKAEQS